MSDSDCHEGVRCVRQGMTRIWVREGIAPEKILEALEQPGEDLKRARKTWVRRVGRCVIKESRAGVLSGLLRHALRGTRYRRAWLAARHLESRGVGVPAAWAYVEYGPPGLVWRNALISEFLDGFRNSEQFLAALIQQGASQETLTLFFECLADAVNSLEAAGAYHGDLSGKNIFTRDGQHFRFIDLDAVELGVEHTDAKRLLNHVQLYDSFFDQVSDRMLVPFVERMMTPGQDPRRWMPLVRNRQQARRLTAEKKWARQGKLLS